ncbi:hypothetical protein C9I89_09020 [Photobacterium lipolyticum]|uniref:Uncharacterized protein n=1 Tax=Photobacterium lipolyticum TaxID=266810 RepID=A0A2T3MZH1_9GAMM|nr:hypothetical protein C9I89_09020 [Photobacterium lipolyticum]
MVTDSIYTIISHEARELHLIFDAHLLYAFAVITEESALLMENTYIPINAHVTGKKIMNTMIIAMNARSRIM